MRADDVMAVDAMGPSGGVRDPRASAFHYADALRATARRLGRKLARRVMGDPAASEDRD